MTQVQVAESGDSRWPLWSMLLYGHFGREATAESQRADRRSRLAIAAFVVVASVIIVMPAPQPAGGQRFLPALVAALLAYLAWERWRYAVALDELSRRLFVESFAVTYLIGLVLFSTFVVLQALTGWTPSPLAYLTLEPVRAAVLVWRSRSFA
jgi:hypothetical protein